MSDAIGVDVARAADALRAGRLVGLPTETVYGLAADATNDDAVARVFAAKGRPRFNPLIVHVADVGTAERHAAFDDRARALAEAFWPGPLTLVLPRRATSDVSLLVSAGLDTIAVRAPAHPIARMVIDAFGGPIAAPSANPSGAISPTSPAHVRAAFAGDPTAVDVVLDGGPSAVGLESTIVRPGPDAALLLRPGGATRDAIEAVLGAPLALPANDAVEAPGMLQSHYAPTAEVRLDADAPTADEAYLGFGDRHGPYRPALNLSPTGDLVEAAANLFAYLRRLDDACRRERLAAIAVAPIPREGLGEAINDRLARAAAPRPT